MGDGIVVHSPMAGGRDPRSKPGQWLPSPSFFEPELDPELEPVLLLELLREEELERPDGADEALEPLREPDWFRPLLADGAERGELCETGGGDCTTRGAGAGLDVRGADDRGDETDGDDGADERLRGVELLGCDGTKGAPGKERVS